MQKSRLDIEESDVGSVGESNSRRMTYLTYTVHKVSTFLHTMMHQQPLKEHKGSISRRKPGVERITYACDQLWKASWLFRSRNSTTAIYKQVSDSRRIDCRGKCVDVTILKSRIQILVRRCEMDGFGGTSSAEPGLGI